MNWSRMPNLSIRDYDFKSRKVEDLFQEFMYFWEIYATQCSMKSWWVCETKFASLSQRQNGWIVLKAMKNSESMKRACSVLLFGWRCSSIALINHQIESGQCDLDRGERVKWIRTVITIMVCLIQSREPIYKSEYISQISLQIFIRWGWAVPTRLM